MKIGAVIVASGYGSCRLSDGIPYPKVMEEIGGMPMICRVATAVISAGIRRLIVIINPLFGPAIRKSLLEWGFTDCRVVIQPERKGAADAVMHAVPVLYEEGLDNILCVYADMPLWTSATINELISLHRRAAPTLSLVTVPLTGEYPTALERYGRVIRDGRDSIVYIVEPVDATAHELSTRSVNPSLWIWERDWTAAHIPYVPFVHKRDEFEPEQYLPPLVRIATKEKKRVEELCLADPWEALGVNNSEELLLVRHYSSSVKRKGKREWPFEKL